MFFDRLVKTKDEDTTVKDASIFIVTNVNILLINHLIKHKTQNIVWCNHHFEEILIIFRKIQLFMIKPLLTFAIGLFSYQAIAQQYCSTDELHYKLYDQQPGIAKKVFQNHLQLESFTQAYIHTHQGIHRSAIYTIPVVFHVIHINGEENISDAQIHDQMRIINEDYQKLNADTVNTINDFKSIAADCQIKFKLAQIDPDGNCTSGITRHYDGRTLVGDHSVKEIVHWDPSMYLNVYVCVEAAGLAGHALLPSAADTISQWDGIVIAHSYVGDIGTGDPGRSVVLTHEIGHYLNLQHVWGGNNVPGYPYLPVGDAGNCAYDDGVTDTPNTIGWSSCNLAHTSCGSLDNVQNFMEYAYCPTMFTEGQKLRMHAALNSPIANRNNLWSASNLTATGVNNPVFCGTEFSQDNNLVCEGTVVQFEDGSYNSVSEWYWTFEGGTPASSTDQDPMITYNAAGTYYVKLVSGDGNTYDSITKISVITVLPSPGIANSIVEGFEANLLPTQLIPLDEGGFSNWEITDSAAVNSNYSLRLNNLYAMQGEKNELVSEVIDLTGVNDLDLSFDYAFAKPTSASIGDNLRIWVSKDCGETWTIRKQLSGTSLLSKTDTIANSFIPTSSEWKNTTVTNITSSYWTNEFRIKIEFNKDGGNHFYLDNINLFDPAMASINLLEESNFRLFPNPASNELNLINLTSHDPTQFKILNCLGETIQIGSFSKQRIISIENLPSGTYFVQFGDLENFNTIKFIKI